MCRLLGHLLDAIGPGHHDDGATLGGRVVHGVGADSHEYAWAVGTVLIRDLATDDVEHLAADVPVSREGFRRSACGDVVDDDARPLVRRLGDVVQLHARVELARLKMQPRKRLINPIADNEAEEVAEIELRHRVASQLDLQLPVNQPDLNEVTDLERIQPIGTVEADVVDAIHQQEPGGLVFDDRHQLVAGLSAANVSEDGRVVSEVFAQPERRVGVASISEGSSEAKKGHVSPLERT